jgi:hypothetical protein
MSTKNLYYRKAFQRENVITSFLFNIAMKLYSYPRLIIEVFIRKNFGRRYFSLSTTITALLVMTLAPVVIHRLPSFSYAYGERPGFWTQYASWYVFVLAYAYFAFKRWMEIQHTPSVFDFKKFSLYSGDIDHRFLDFNLFGTPSLRRVETLYEPGLFFLAGVILKMTGQPLGILLMVCALFYSLSYLAAYKQGDDLLQDLIDEKLMNEEFRGAFVNELLGHQTRGVRYYMNKPSSPELREEMEEYFMPESEGHKVFTYAE